ncbi:carbohydrate kinase family protein [Glutamicibacter sp. AOP38-B1-38]|uniref:carbohydrate kinase family protein n=1 Tax=unclassified Glutamicibacter TaxID=2627139 RepID=UPI0040331FFB
MAQIQVVGEALADIVDDVAHPGGSPMNVAVGLGRLGHQVNLHTELGEDAYGKLIAAHLENSGVALAAGSFAQQSTNSATVSVDGVGDASYEFDLSWELPGGVPSSEAQLLHAGSIAGWLAPGCEKVLEAFQASPSTQLRSYDPNLRPQLIPKRAAALKQVEKLMGLSHVVKLSDDDALWLYPGWDCQRILDHILERGAKLAVMTFGARGATARTKNTEVLVHSRAVKVVDSIGAGDAFMSGLLHGLLNSSLAQALITNGETLDQKELESALALATRCSELTVLVSGANPPRLEQLNESFQDQTS